MMIKRIEECSECSVIGVDGLRGIEDWPEKTLTEIFEDMHARVYHKKINKAYFCRVFCLTTGRRFIVYRLTRVKHKVVYDKIIPDDAKYVYYCALPGNRFVATFDERELFHEVFDHDKTLRDVRVVKISANHVPWNTQFLNGSRHDEDHKFVDDILDPLIDDPETYYDKLMERMSFEDYIVFRDGRRVCAHMHNMEPYAKGYYEFINPERWEAMKSSDIHIVDWGTLDFYEPQIKYNFPSKAEYGGNINDRTSEDSIIIRKDD